MTWKSQKSKKTKEKKMKVKNLILICVVILLVVIGLLFFVLKKGNGEVTEGNIEITEELGEVTESAVTIVNHTGKEITGVYLNRDGELDDNGFEVWESVLNEEKLGADGEGDITIINYDESSVLRLFISTESDDEIEYDGVITSEYIVDNPRWTLALDNDELVVEEIPDEEVAEEGTEGENVEVVNVEEPQN